MSTPPNPNNNPSTEDNKEEGNTNTGNTTTTTSASSRPNTALLTASSPTLPISSSSTVPISVKTFGGYKFREWPYKEEAPSICHLIQPPIRKADGLFYCKFPNCNHPGFRDHNLLADHFNIVHFKRCTECPVCKKVFSNDDDDLYQHHLAEHKKNNKNLRFLPPPDPLGLIDTVGRIPSVGQT